MYASHWDKQVLRIEVKQHPEKYDPFDDEEGQAFQVNVEERARYRDQIISYADMLFRTQHRAYCFTVVIICHCARIIRWDKSEAIVTDKVDYKEHPGQLAEFFWRFAHMTKEEQGYDTTVNVVAEGPDDYKRMELVKSTPRELDDHGRELFAQSLADPDTPRLKIRVYAEDVESSLLATRGKDYLVGKPHCVRHSVLGRCTGDYVALDAEANRLVWLKDAWRANLSGLEKEGDPLQDSNKKCVQNVPTFVCHGDVPGQITLARRIWEDLYGPAARTAVENKYAARLRGEPTAGEGDSVRGERQPLFSRRMDDFHAHVHYRLVTEEVCLPLDAFQDGRELIGIVCDRLIAHQQVYKLLSLLHGDGSVSAGNILISVEIVNGQPWRGGISADWESAKVADKDPFSRPRQLDRKGTWQFMSASSLLNPLRPLTLHDDLESFHHLIIFEGARLIPSNCRNMAAFILAFFHVRTMNRGPHKYTCGLDKLYAMESGVLRDISDTPILFGGYKTYPLNSFLVASFRIFSSYYRVIQHDRDTSGDSDESELLDEDPVTYIAMKKIEEQYLAIARKEAKLLDSHDEYIRFLKLCIRKHWPDQDKLSTD